MNGNSSETDYGFFKNYYYYLFTLVRKAEEDNVLYHPAELTTPVMFSFRPKSFFGQKKASIRIEDSDWSDRFSLDAAGSSGTVLCRADDRTYQLGVHIQLSNEGLTKQVIDY